jgi:aminoglycoside 2'-N-acetyltransferase I
VTPPFSVRRVTTAGLTPAEVSRLRELLDASFNDPEERFSEDDWDHSLGGVHVLAEEGGRIVGHAAVVARDIRVDGTPVRTGYVEAVATDPLRQGHGIGSALMREVATILDEEYQLGALGTGSQGFYERLGWTVWRGPSSVRLAEGEHPTPQEDGYIMALRTRSSPELDPEAPISCEWRPGDVW